MGKNPSGGGLAEEVEEVVTVTGQLLTKVSLRFSQPIPRVLY